MQESPASPQAEQPQEKPDPKILELADRVTRTNVFVTTGDLLQKNLQYVQRALPEFHPTQPGKHSISELETFLKKTNDNFVIATVIQYMTEHPEARAGTNTVRPFLANKDPQVSTAAIAFMIKHSPAEELPDHLKRLHDTLDATLKSERRDMQQYRQNVIASMLRAQRTGRGDKAYMLLDNPVEERQYFSRFSSLADAYGAALNRGQNVLPQVQTLMTAENPIGLVSTGKALLQSGRYEEWTLLMRNGTELQRDGLALALNAEMFSVPKSDLKRRTALQDAARSIVSSDIPLTSTQRRLLEAITK